MNPLTFALVTFSLTDSGGDTGTGFVKIPASTFDMGSLDGGKHRHPEGGLLP